MTEIDELKACINKLERYETAIVRIERELANEQIELSTCNEYVKRLEVMLYATIEDRDRHSEQLNRRDERIAELETENRELSKRMAETDVPAETYGERIDELKERDDDA